jgi:leader peptidase (prepilin peptidase)/N-methyltransferase
MAVLYALYFLIAIAKPGGMGFGDVKLAGVLGLYLGWVGWGALAVGTFLGFLIGGLVGIALMIGGRATRRTGLPFGPFMLVGALIAILVGERLADAYLGAL